MSNTNAPNIELAEELRSWSIGVRDKFRLHHDQPGGSYWSGYKGALDDLDRKIATFCPAGDACAAARRQRRGGFDMSAEKRNPDPRPGISHAFGCTHDPCVCRDERTPMPDLTKIRTVLPLAGDDDASAYFQITPEDEPCACRVWVDPDVFADMGSPDVITVTIEPGDLLNAPLGGVPGSAERAFNEAEGDRSE